MNTAGWLLLGLVTHQQGDRCLRLNLVLNPAAPVAHTYSSQSASPPSVRSDSPTDLCRVRDAARPRCSPSSAVRTILSSSTGTPRLRKYTVLGSYMGHDKTHCVDLFQACKSIANYYYQFNVKVAPFAVRRSLYIE